jgi:RNA-binding protein YhbY
MTGIEHAILATTTIAAFFYAGKWLGKKEKVEDIVEHTLNMLEKNNMIKVKICEKTGEKDILPLDKYEKIW